MTPCCLVYFPPFVFSLRNTSACRASTTVSSEELGSATWVLATTRRECAWPRWQGTVPGPRACPSTCLHQNVTSRFSLGHWQMSLNFQLQSVVDHCWKVKLFFSMCSAHLYSPGLEKDKTRETRSMSLAILQSSVQKKTELIISDYLRYPSQMNRIADSLFKNLFGSVVGCSLFNTPVFSCRR